MVRVRCIIGPGLIESDRVVYIPTTSGHREEAFVSETQVRDDRLIVPEVGVRNGSVLIELPRESSRGYWRVWVPADQVEREL